MASKKQATKKTKGGVSLEELLEAGAHFGHQSRRWNPLMKPYIWVARDGVHIFDLAVSAKKLEEAVEFLEQVAAEGKRIVMVGTKRQAAKIVREEAQKAGVAFMTERWLGGTLTNWGQIRGRVEKLVRMKKEQDEGAYKKYTKKEQVLISREIDRLERFFGGLVGLEGSLPEVMFVVDVSRERVAVKEAKDKGLTVVAVVDSNSDPRGVDWVIPANDDAVRSIKLIVEKVGVAIAAGRKVWEKKAKKLAAAAEKK